MSGAAGTGWARAVASFGGCGFAPWAPGTVGSLAALVPGVLLLWPGGLLAGWLLAIGCLLVSLLGWQAVRAASGGADHGWIVIDEVAGIWLTLLALPDWPGLTALHGTVFWSFVLAAFLLFRLLDIAKPGPIGRLDRRHDAAGVMGDDLAAGVIGAIVLLLGRIAMERLA